MSSLRSTTLACSGWRREKARRRLVRSAQRCAPVDRDTHASLGFLVVLDGFLQEIEVADHDAQHVVEVVGDAAGQAADRLELAGMEQAAARAACAR